MRMTAATAPDLPVCEQARLSYRPPYDLGALLDFLRPRALPGIEVVDKESYARVIGPRDAPGWVRVSAWPEEGHALRLELHCPKPTRLQGIITRVRRMFDLDADPGTINATLAADDGLRPLVERDPGLRLPGGWSGFETAVRAVLGQQVSVAAAGTLAARLTERLGEPLESPFGPGLERHFPTPGELADADLDGIGLTGERAATVRRLAQALVDGRVDFRSQRTLGEFVERWTALRGIGPWTAHYLAMRALGQADAFPAADLVLRRAATNGDGPPVSARELTGRAERWRPWRAYAVLHLWHSVG